MFGDSYAHGYGMSDCMNLHYSHSRFVWPSVLQRMLSSFGSNTVVVNKAIPGASSLLINTCVRSFEFQPGDVVLILWTFMSRTTIFLDRHNFDHVLFMFNVKLYEMLPDYDFDYKSACAVEHTYRLLKHRGIPYVGWYINARETPIHDRHYNAIDFFHGDSDRSKLFFDFWQDDAIDGQHPGPETHRAFARHAYSTLVARRLLSPPPQNARENEKIAVNNVCTRIIAFGDGVPTSMIHWSSILQQLLHPTTTASVVNKSTPGASCILIRECVRSFDFQPGDVALILWTFLHRSTIFFNKNNYENITPSGSKHSKLYEIMPSYDFEYKSACAVEHTHLFLKEHAIPYVSWYYDAQEVPRGVGDFFHGDCDRSICFAQESHRAFARHVYDTLVTRHLV